MDKPKVLIVDDNVTFSVKLAAGLEKTGFFDVKIENVSSHALSTARTFVPDIFLCDVIMPDVDGCEVATEIKNDPQFSSTPIVFMTWLISEQEADNGRWDYLSKPTRLRDAVLCIQHNLNKANHCHVSPHTLHSLSDGDIYVPIADLKD